MEVVESTTLFFWTCLCIVQADIYLHNPRGSNDRLNEKSANRANANRLFDSQNNNRGGYNVGDRTTKPATTEEEQYQMVYFQSTSKMNPQKDSSDRGTSFLRVEWTNQHGCGGNDENNPHKDNCQLILQYTCQPDTNTPDKYTIRDGTTTQTQEYTKPKEEETKAEFETRKDENVAKDRAYVEEFEFYDKCQTRERNKELFTADQTLKGTSAKYTRQNPNGNRYGYECPEERDYYPYWHPTRWVDVGVFTTNTSRCPYYRSESFNVRSKWECVEKWEDGSAKHFSKHNNKDDCEAKKNNGEWLEFHNYLEKANEFKSESDCISTQKKKPGSNSKYIWARPMYGYTKECLVALAEPFCEAAPFTRDNHLGNGVDLEAVRMSWRIPYFPSGATQRCMLRMRYNISTDDYNPHNTSSAYNGKLLSPVIQNPAIDVGAQNTPMRLAIHTAQYGRTFQDRSHIFFLKPRPSNTGDEVIHNLNIRGKRGNIVQVYPAVEYDFFPTDLDMKSEDMVHIQWTGSNTHNNDKPAGDGQAGDDGEGKKGTDRNNIVGLRDRLDNFPLPMEHPQSIFNNIASVEWASYVDKEKLTNEGIAVQFASAGYYQCVEETTCGAQSLEKKSELDPLLNGASPSFGGMLLKLKKGNYHIMCTRNNNFSHRAQKGTINVK